VKEVTSYPIYWHRSGAQGNNYNEEAAWGAQILGVSRPARGNKL
jgi:hypothetical protein